MIEKYKFFFTQEREDSGDIWASMSREWKSCQVEKDQLDLRAQQ